LTARRTGKPSDRVPEKAYIALGSNLGDRMEHLRAAGRALRDAGVFHGLRFSPVYETRPVGGPGDQADYLNAVVQVEGGPGPEGTLEVLKSIERGLGRIEGERWGPRVIDLDLLMYGCQVLETPDLTLPHPRFHVRRFVLVPLNDLAPAAVHPVLGIAVSDLLAGLGPEEGAVRRVLEGPFSGPRAAAGPFPGLGTAP